MCTHFSYISLVLQTSSRYLPRSCFIKSINYDAFHYTIFSFFLLFSVLLSGASKRLICWNRTFQFHFQWQQTRNTSAWEDAEGQGINSQMHERNLCERRCWYLRATYALPVKWKLFQGPSLFVNYQILANSNKLLRVIYINLTLYAPCIILQSVYKPTRCTKCRVIRLYLPLNSVHVSDYVSPSSGATFESCTSHLMYTGTIRLAVVWL